MNVNKGTEMIPETPVIFNQLTGLVALEDFINNYNIAEGHRFPMLCSTSLLKLLLFLVSSIV
jgi:hypothetical protein